MIDRYARQRVLPQVGDAGQMRLAAARVLVVGAGGLGATVLPALAGAGVGHLRIVDADRVSESNLHRQTLFSMADLGQPKAASAAARLSTLNPDPKIEVWDRWLDPALAPAALAGCDLVIDAADSFAASYILSDHCQRQGIPLISASALGMTGYVGGFCGGAPSLRAVFPDLPQRAATCASAGVLGPVVATLGALQAQMALSVLLELTPSPLGQVLTVDLAGLRLGGFRFDGAPEPATALPFIARSDLTAQDQVIDLRGPAEAPTPVTPGAQRLQADDAATWPPLPPGRIVLCCRSGLRAWRAARHLAGLGHRDLALVALGDE